MRREINGGRAAGATQYAGLSGRRRPPTLPGPPTGPLRVSSPDLAFVACIEGNALEAQALLLFESIRRWGGRFRDAPIHALSPRRGPPLAAATRRALDRLEVLFDDRELNRDAADYGSANRVAAAAFVEAQYGHERLVVLDSDTLFLREPTDFLLADGVDAALRPVDLKGSASTGVGDPMDDYWRALCRSAAVDYDTVPWSATFVDGRPIKASYNGGLVVVRGGLGLMQRWAEVFFRSVREGLRPYREMQPFRAGAGAVPAEVGRDWGSNQAALSVALWSATRGVVELTPRYNYPLHLHDSLDPGRIGADFRTLVHVHYHWLFAEPNADNPIFDQPGPLDPERREWLEQRLPLRLPG